MTKQHMVIFRCKEPISFKITKAETCQYKFYAAKSFSQEITTITEDSKMRGVIFKPLSFKIPSLTFFFFQKTSFALAQENSALAQYQFLTP